jgi:hypothetical protein
MSNTKIFGWAEEGGSSVLTEGLSSTTKVEQSFPLCTVSIFDAGTTNLSTVYSNASGTPKANPFTSASDGFWFFYAPEGSHFDVQFSGIGITTFTLFDLIAPTSGSAPPATTTGFQVYNVTDPLYGADPTGVLDSIPGFNAALAAAVAARKGIIYIPPGNYKINSTWIIGDGTSTTISTYAGISIIGAGSVRLNNVTPLSAVRIFWNGMTSLTAVMARIAGPIGGFAMRGLHFDCNNACGIGLQVMHAPDADIQDISIWGYTGVGFDVDSYGVASFNGGTEITNNYGDAGVARNISMVSVNNNTIGLRLGKTGTLANWLFDSLYISQDGTANSAATELRFTDHCMFANCLGSAEQGVRIKPISTAAGFPINTFFFGGSWRGQHAQTLQNGAIGTGDVTITVLTTVGFPSTGVLRLTDFSVLETVTYTGITPTTFTGVVRGQYGTTAVAHASGGLVIAANDVVIDNSDATWAPTAGYGIYFNPFATADGAIVPTDPRIWGVTDTKQYFGQQQFRDFTGFGFFPFTALAALHLKVIGETGLRIQGQTSRLDFYSDQPAAGARNWSIRLDNTAFGDFAIYQSNAIGGDPIAAGVQRFYIGPTGAFVISGTATNDNAAAGKVGEFIEGSAAVGSISLVTGVAKTIVSISLTAGDWDVASVCYFTPAGTTTIGEIASSVSQVNNTLDTTAGTFTDDFRGNATSSNAITHSIPRRRISLAGTTTIYLVGLAAFGVSTMTTGGYISARRVR